eukprot:CAMPEP_0194095804 /NCGR_PEP_ID=MMETSP0149-20130528/57016_1 /TAXON_ID=122233 /ORGANISM="Chaetoceros debilis, Strain MM31A-1" /LENGTH=527 /DNA_ID=CAMNT_0038781761 /DNA_START=251 /DNA_END=1833 /DNA_ORIENTATION=-
MMRNSFNRKSPPSAKLASTSITLPTVASTDSSDDDYAKLKDIMEANCKENLPIIVVDPEEEREEYSSEEIASLPKRDFKTRLFISALHSTDNSFWVRTHHTDSTIHALSEVFSYIEDYFEAAYARKSHITAKPLSYIEDYFEAAYARKSHITAKATVTAGLTELLQMEKDEYCAFATIMGSGLAKNGACTSFEIDNALVKSTKDMDDARKRLVILMDIIFNKIIVRRFLIDGDKVNIFRLVHCLTKGQKNKNSFVYVIFSLLLQACMVYFVAAEVFSTDSVERDPTLAYGLYSLATLGSFVTGLHGIFVAAEVFSTDSVERDPTLAYGLYSLATLGSIFGIFALLPDVINAKTIRRIYGGYGPLQMIDFIVNVVMPLVLVVIGWYLVSIQDNYIDAVIMTTALLFISEIDDQLPALVGLNKEVIVVNYLIREAKIDYNAYQGFSVEDIDNMIGSDVKKSARNLFGGGMQQSTKSRGVDFNDFFITNSIDDHENTMYKPFSVIRSDYGHEIDPSDFISHECLLQSVEW